MQRRMGRLETRQMARTLGKLAVAGALLALVCLAGQHYAMPDFFHLGVADKCLEPFAGAVLAKIAVLVFIVLFIQKRPRGLFPLKGRAVEA